MTTETFRAATAEDLARIAGFNRTNAEFPDNVSIHELIEARLDQFASHTAVICDHDKAFGTTKLTYAELNARANQLAHRLRAEGVKPGEIVALMVERSFAMIVGILGIVKAGAAYLPLSPENPADRTAYVLQDAGAKLLLVHGKTAGRVKFDGLTLDLDDASLYQGAAHNPALANGPRDLAYVIYTSGSTGRPKGVMIEHRSLVNRLHWMQRAYPIGPGDVILQKTPYYFDVSVWELFWWALQGATLCFLVPGGERHPLVILDTIRRHKVNVLHFVPSMLNVFLEYLDGKAEGVRRELATVRNVFASGEALTPSHVKRFNAVWGGLAGSRLINLYGPTEATVDVSHFDCPAGDDVGDIPIGRPIDNTRFYIVRDGQQVAIGETGELLIGGVGVARGYLNNPALTAERFIDSPFEPGERLYRTGDIARWRPDGNVEYLGREDFQVKIRGLRIELGEIENTVREYPGITDCVAVVRQYSENVILIIAYVVCPPDFALEPLKQFLGTRLPDYMVPNHFEILAALPLTPSGKADRKALPEPTLQARAS